MHSRSRLRRGTLAVLLLLSATAPDAAASLAEVRGRGALRLCANPAALPYSSRSGENGLFGFQLELAQAIAGEMGLGLTVIWPPGAARSGGCDLTLDQVPLAARYEREGVTGPLMGRATVPLRFSKPYAAGGVFLIVPPGSHARRFEDVGSGKIGVLVDSIEAGWLAGKGLRISIFPFPDEILAAVASGEVSAGAVSLPAIGWYRHQHPDAGIAVPKGYAPEPGLRWNLAIALWQADDPLVEAVNAALDRVIHAGLPERIYARYGIDYRAPFAVSPEGER